MHFSNIRLAFEGTGGTVYSAIDLPVDSAILTSPFVLKSAEGLGPPDINISVSNSVDSGSSYRGLQPQPRQPVLLIGYQPNYASGQTVADLRALIYGLLTPVADLPVTLAIQDASRVTIARTYGQISKIEPNIFSKDPEVQITLVCFSAYLQNWNQVIASPGTMSTNPIVLTNIGDAPSGFNMSIKLTADRSMFSLTDPYGTALKFNYNFVANDVITFDTTPGSRMAKVTRAGVDTNLLPYQDPSSVWLQMRGGANSYTPSTQSIVILSAYLNYNYWGV